MIVIGEPLYLFGLAGAIIGISGTLIVRLLYMHPAFLKDLPDCKDEPGFDRAAFNNEFNAAVLAFFREHPVAR
jgi:hypothetical protein